MYLVTAEEMQRMDRATIDDFGIPGRVLMESAGRGTVRVLLHLAAGMERPDIAVAAGRGNNGGDGFVVARYLAQLGIPVTVYLMSSADRVSGDAADNLALLPKLNIPVIEIPDAPALASHRHRMAQHTLWVDALFGTGLHSDVRGHYIDLIALINDASCPVLAVDIPSGIDADTGRVCGTCVTADATATFAYPKIGHWQYPGAHHCGQLEVIDIGIPPVMAETVAPRQMLITRDEVFRRRLPRSAWAHKGTTGHLLVVAGSPGKTGAAAMCVNAALRCGAGLVTAAVTENIRDILEHLTVEAMTVGLSAPGDVPGMAAAPEIEHLLSGKQCLALGPGLGMHEDTGALVRHLVGSCRLPVVVDADGLNHLATAKDAMRTHPAPMILTPHPGEMARLCGCRTEDVQADRVMAARDLAARCNAVVVLKGAGTVIAAPEGTVWVNATGNPGMASGGMGDVLTGMIAGFLTQGHDPLSAAIQGVYLHGDIGDHLAETTGPIGYLATDMLEAIPQQIHRLTADDAADEALPWI